MQKVEVILESKLESGLAVIGQAHKYIQLAWTVQPLPSHGEGFGFPKINLRGG